MAEKNNKGFGALDDLSSDIQEKSPNAKPKTLVKKTSAPEIKKTNSAVNNTTIKSIQKSPIKKRKQTAVRNRRYKSQGFSSNNYKPYISQKEWNFLWLALFVILIIYFSMDDSENSNNKEEAAKGNTFNYSEKVEVGYYSLPSNEAKNIVSQGWENMSKRSSVDNPDYKRAFELNLKGFNLGHPEGATNLGNLYELGLGVPQNLDLALSWYEQAIARGAYHSADAELGVVRTKIRLKLNSGSDFTQSDINELRKYINLARKKTTEYNLWPASTNERYISEANNLQKDIEFLASEENKKTIEDKSSREIKPDNLSAEPERILEETPLSSQGYVSLYTDRKTYGVFGWSAGYKTQDEANQAAYDICMKRGARNPCEYLYGSFARCVAIAESPKWIQSGVGNTKKEAEEQALAICEKHGVSCMIPQDGSGCSK